MPRSSDSYLRLFRSRRLKDKTIGGSYICYCIIAYDVFEELLERAPFDIEHIWTSKTNNKLRVVIKKKAINRHGRVIGTERYAILFMLMRRRICQREVAQHKRAVLCRSYVFLGNFEYALCSYPQNYADYDFPTAYHARRIANALVSYLIARIRCWPLRPAMGKYIEEREQ